MTAIHEDNPHKMSKSIFWEKYIKMLSAEIVPNKLSVIIFFFFFILGLLPFKNISLLSSRSFIKGGQKLENLWKNHLTLRKQNLAFHM